MRKIIYMGAVAILAVCGVMGQDNFFRPMKGSATPEFQMSNADGGRCLVFGTHIVKTTLAEDGGENVMMFDREGKARGMDACELSSGPYATINDSDNNSFFGISAKYFFIDQGTSSGSRTLLIFKTDTGGDVTAVEYNGDPRIEAARYLFYDAPSDRQGRISTCKNASKWKRQGGGVGWVQGKKMDINTQKTTNVGVLRCIYVE